MRLPPPRCVCKCSNWVGNCIGRQNHKMFVAWAVLQLVAEVVMLFFFYLGACGCVLALAVPCSSRCTLCA